MPPARRGRGLGRGRGAKASAANTVEAIDNSSKVKDDGGKEVDDVVGTNAQIEEVQARPEIDDGGVHVKDEVVQIKENEAEEAPKAIEASELNEGDESVEANESEEATYLEVKEPKVIELDEDPKDEDKGNASSEEIMEVSEEVSNFEGNKKEHEESKKEESLDVTGVIFQFNLDVVLFEFSSASCNGGDEAIGVVKTVDILKAGGSGSRADHIVPEGTNTLEKVGQYFQAGDEVRCLVVRRDNLDPFSYVEDEEEIGEDGNVSHTSRTVEIKPEWLAQTATLVEKSGGVASSGNLNKEEIGAIEQQIEGYLDYEEDILLIEDVKIDDVLIEKPEAKKAAVKKKPDPQSKKGKEDKVKKTPESKKRTRIEAPPSDKVSLKSIPKPVPTRKMTGVAEKSAITPKKEGEVVYTEEASVVQLRKPSKGTKVTAMMVRIETGQFKGHEIVAHHNSMHMWGRVMSNVTLMTPLIRHGDICTVEMKVQSGFPMVKHLWFGTKTEKPMKAGQDAKLAIFLANRGMDEHMLNKWLKDEAPNKPFFPFEGPVLEATVTGFGRDSKTDKVCAAFLKIKEDDDTSPEEALKPPGEEDDKEMEMEPPSNRSNWNPLHYLQEYIKNKREDEIIIDDKIVQLGNNMEFQFNALTNFQASSEDDKGMFYDLGTLVFFMKNRKGSYTQYMADAKKAGHAHTVNKADHRHLIAYLDGSANVAPPNLRPMSEMLKCSANTGKEKISKAFVLREDLYIGGVSTGQADLRLLISIGDSVKCQVMDLTNSEKRKYRTALVGCSGFNHQAYFTYVGEKRPRKGARDATTSLELKSYLDTRGLSVQEFESMKYPTVELAKHIQDATNVLPTMPVGNRMSNTIPDMARSVVASNLATKAMLISKPDDPSVIGLLTTPEEIQVAVYLAKVLTQSLLQRMQQSLRSKLQTHFNDQFASPEFKQALEEQATKIVAAETSLQKPGHPNSKLLPAPVSKMTLGKTTQLQANDSVDSIVEKLKVVENKMTREYRIKQAAIKETSVAKKPVRDMRKVLDSYKVIKEASKEEDNQGKEKDWTPLEYLRYYMTNKKKVTMDKKTIWFGTVGFPRDTITNFRSEQGQLGEKKKFYTLETLYVCMLHRGMKHYRYLDKVKEQGFKSHVNFRDKSEVIDWVSGKADEKQKPKHIKNVSHRELNPQLFGDHKPTSSSKVSKRQAPLGGTSSEYGSKRAKSDEEAKKAKLQMEMIAKASKVQPLMNVDVPVPLSNPVVSRQSRFDMSMHPKAMAQQPQQMQQMNVHHTPTQFSQLPQPFAAASQPQFHSQSQPSMSGSMQHLPPPHPSMAGSMQQPPILPVPVGPLIPYGFNQGMQQMQHNEEQRQIHIEDQRRRHEEDQRRQHEEEQRRRHEEEQRRRHEEEERRRHEEELLRRRHQEEEERKQHDEKVRRQHEKMEELRKQKEEEFKLRQQAVGQASRPSRGWGASATASAGGQPPSQLPQPKPSLDDLYRHSLANPDGHGRSRSPSSGYRNDLDRAYRSMHIEPSVSDDLLLPNIRRNREAERVRVPDTSTSDYDPLEPTESPPPPQRRREEWHNVRGGHNPFEDEDKRRRDEEKERALQRYLEEQEQHKIWQREVQRKQQEEDRRKREMEQARIATSEAKREAEKLQAAKAAASVSTQGGPQTKSSWNVIDISHESDEEELGIPLRLRAPSPPKLSTTFAKVRVTSEADVPPDPWSQLQAYQQEDTRKRLTGFPAPNRREGEEQMLPTPHKLNSGSTSWSKEWGRSETSMWDRSAASSSEQQPRWPGQARNVVYRSDE